MNKIKKFITACEERKIGFGQWLIAGLAVVLLRTTIEPVVAGGGLPFIHPFYLVHVPLFFVSLLLAVIVLLHFFTKTDIVKVSKLALIFFPVILLPVMIDFFFVLLTRTKVMYCYICYDVGLNFINFFNPFFSIPDFPLTLRLELAVIAVLSFSYIFFKRHNVFISLVGAFFIFGACFFYVAIPGIFVNFCVFLTLSGFTFYIHVILCVWHRQPVAFNGKF